MSRRDSREPFTMFPNRFIDAEMFGDLSERQAKLLRCIARRGSQVKRETRLTLAEVAADVGWPWAYDTLIRELKRVRPEWIDFESTQGQRTPYVFRWTGLAVRREGDLELGQDSTSARLPHDFRKKAPQEPPQTGSAEADETHDPNGKTPPHEPPHDPDGSPLPLTSTESSEVNAASEEKLGPVVGKTTAAKAEPEFPELLDRLEPNPFHENGGLLLSDDEIAELGTLPLEELHRRRERGEL